METKEVRVIDSHLHYQDYEGFDQIAIAAGYTNTEASLQQAFTDNHILAGIVMGNESMELTAHHYPPYLHYCVGLDQPQFNDPSQMEQVAQMVEKNLQNPQCCGIKLYPGYNHVYVYDNRYEPIYELARQYQKPVAIHTGLTATANALLKYSHPLTLDEVAVKHPDVQFVMCHFGNPFLADAIAVLEKNQNVAVDLSGLLEGKIPDWIHFFREKQGYITMLHDWLRYLDAYDRVMFGTDWPLANYTDYITFVKSFIPEPYWDAVFFQNANRIYQMNLT